MLKVKNIIIFGICLACYVILAVFYSTAYPSHLLWQEQNQIFLNTSHWVASYFSKPAWLGCLAGDWLTQFYHNPVVGAVILTLAIACCTACFATAAARILSCKTQGRYSRAATIILTLLFAILLISCSMSATTTLAFFICVAGGLATGLVNISIHAGKERSIDISPFW